MTALSSRPVRTALPSRDAAISDDKTVIHAGGEVATDYSRAVPTSRLAEG